MSTTKYKTTGFTRLLLFLILFIPIAWSAFTIGSGKDIKEEFETIKEKIGLTGTADKSSSPSKSNLISTLKEKETYILELEEKLARCENALRETTIN